MAITLSISDVRRACDARRVVRFSEGGLSRVTAFDGAVVFGSLGALTLVALIVIGAPFSSIALVTFAFLALIGVAAREYVADLVAGALLHFVQPYSPGDVVHLYWADRRRHVDAKVVKLGAVHTTMVAPEGELQVPNHALLSDSAA